MIGLSCKICFIVASIGFEPMSKPYESSVRNQLYQLAIFVELPRLELGTEACKATVFAIYTITPFILEHHNRLELITSYLARKRSTLELVMQLAATSYYFI